jgi:hypothetical protein
MVCIPTHHRCVPQHVPARRYRDGAYARSRTFQAIGTRGSGVYEQNVPVRTVAARCRPSAGFTHEEIRDPIEETKARLVRVLRRRTGQIGQPLADDWKGAGDVRRSAPQVGSQSTLVRGSNARRHDLCPGPVGRCPVAVVPATDENRRSHATGQYRQLVSGARLPDPRFASQEHDPAAARYALLQRLAEQAHLGVASDEGKIQREVGSHTALLRCPRRHTTGSSSRDTRTAPVVAATARGSGSPGSSARLSGRD